MLGLEAGIDARDAREAAQEERRADEEHDRHRDLGDEQPVAHPASARRGR